MTTVIRLGVVVEEYVAFEMVITGNPLAGVGIRDESVAYRGL
jgi:hypothetical protein